jgi:serine/threonine protein kinase
MHGQIADYVLRHFSNDPRYGAVFQHLNFNCLRVQQLKAIVSLAPFQPALIGHHNMQVIVEFISSLHQRIDSLEQSLRATVAGIQPTVSAPRAPAPLTQESVDAVRSAADEWRCELANTTPGIETKIDAIRTDLDRHETEITTLQRHIAVLQTSIASVQPTKGGKRWSCDNVFHEYQDHCVVSSFPVYMQDKLSSLLFHNDGTMIWSSDVTSGAFPAITVELKHGYMVLAQRYRLRCPQRVCIQTWMVFGRTGDVWKRLDSRERETVLSDGKSHDFFIAPPLLAVDAIRLSITGRNQLGSRQMHIQQFIVMGDVFLPDELRYHCAVEEDLLAHDAPSHAPIAVHPGKAPTKDVAVVSPASAPRQVLTEVSPVSPPPKGPSVPDFHKPPPPSPALSAIDEQRNLPSPDAESTIAPGFHVSQRDPLITDLSGIEVLKDLGSGRSRTVKLVRTLNGQLMVAKIYNPGSNPDRLSDVISRFVSLSHSNLIPITGVIPPSPKRGPTILTPYSEAGSLQDVFACVANKEPPDFWNEKMKWKVVVALASACGYLHEHQIVHGRLKPSDVIITPDRESVIITDYFSDELAARNVVAAFPEDEPWYVPPELDGEPRNLNREVHSKADVYAFAMIIYEVFCGTKIFPATMSFGLIKRKRASSKAGDRPVIPSSVPAVISDIIMSSWRAIPRNRLSFKEILTRLASVDV